MTDPKPILEDAVGKLAAKAAGQSSAGLARDFAEAAKLLAEADAWLRSASQPH